MTGIAQNTAHGVAWVFGGGIAKAVIQFIPIAILTRLLSPQEFGVFTIVIVVVYIAELLAFGGVGPSLVRAKTLTPKMIGAAIWIALGVGISSALVIVALSGVIADTLNMPALRWPLVAAAVGFPINAFSVIGARLQQRALKQAFQVGADITSYAFGYYAIGLTLAFQGFGVWALVAAFLSQSVARALMHSFRVRDALTLATDTPALVAMARTSLPLMAAHLIAELQLNLDKFILGYATSAAPLGLYGRASDLSLRVTKLFDEIVQRVIFPAFSRNQQPHSATDEPAATHLVDILTLCLIVVGALAIILHIFSTEIITFAFGMEFAPAATPFSYLALAIVPIILTRVLAAFMHAGGRFAASSKLEGLSLLFYIAASITGAYLGGITGVALGILCASFIKLMIYWTAVTALGPTKIATHAIELTAAFPLLGLTYLSAKICEQYLPKFGNIAVDLAANLSIPLGVICLVSLILPSVFLRPIRWVIRQYAPDNTSVVAGWLTR